MSVHTTPDSYTKLLIHSDGPDNGQTFVDSSGNHTISAEGDVKHENTQTKFGSTSIYFDGTTDWLKIPESTDWDIAGSHTGSFTIDLWVKHDDHVGQETYLTQSPSGNSLWRLRNVHGTGLSFQIYDGGSIVVDISGGEIVDTLWHHVALVKVGNSSDSTWTIYKDGISVATGTDASAWSMNSGNRWLGIGGNSEGGDYYAGYMDEIRYSKGIARWTDSFVPPNKPYSVVDDDFVTDVIGIEDVGDGITKLSSDIILKPDPSEASTDSVFSASAKDGSVLLDVRADGMVTKPNLPAFMARPSGVQSALNIDQQITVAFGTEIFDQGGNFASNTFTAPVTGKYQLSFSVLFKNLDTASSYYQAKIVTNNREYSTEYDPNFSADVGEWTCTASVLADMSVNHTAVIKVKQPSGTQQTTIAVDSWFSGYLVC